MMIRRGGGPSGGGGPPPPFSSLSTLSPLAPPFTVDRTPVHPHPNFSSPPPPPPAYPPPFSRHFIPPPANPNPPIDRPSPSSSATQLVPSLESIFRSTPQSRGLGSFCYQPFDALESSFLDYEGFGGADVGHWIGPFDGEEVLRAKGGDGGFSWMDTSSGYKVSSFPKGAADEDCISYENASDVWCGKSRKLHFEWPQDKNRTVYEEKSIAPCNISEASVQAPNALLKRVPYSQLTDSISVMESCDAFNSNSSYDKYLAQLDSCSTNPMAYYPATTYSTASARGTTTSMDYSTSKKGYITIRHGDPYKMNADYADHIPTMPKESSTNQNVEGKERNGERRRVINMEMNSGISLESFPMEKGFPSFIESATGNSWDYSSTVKPDLKIKSLTFPNAFTFELGSAEPDDSVQNSSEALDHAVDSPCWKGASASRQLPFGIGETIGLCPAVMESKGCNDLDKDQNHLPTNIGYSEHLSFSEQVEELICDEDKKDSSITYLMESSSIAVLPSIQEKHDPPSIIESDCVKDANGKRIQFSDIYKEQRSQATNDRKVKYEAKNNEAARLDRKESLISANQPTSADVFANPMAGLKSAQDSSSVCHPCAKGHVTTSSFSGATTGGDAAERLDSSVLSGKPSSLGKDAQLLVKTLLNLSEMLLSSYYSDASELKDHDLERILLVIDNLETLALKNKKDVAKRNFHASALEAAQSQLTGLEADVFMNPSNINNTHDTKGKMHSIGSSINSDKLHNYVYNGGTSVLSRVNSMTQAFERILEKEICEEENPQTLLYKNLWIEAEVALCSMKYELQVARMNTEIESHKHLAEDCAMKPQQMTNFSSPDSSVLDLGEHEAPLKAKEILFSELSIPWADAVESSRINPHRTLPPVTSKAVEEVDASVMARLRVLKGRADILDSTSMEKQQKPHGMLLDSDSGAEETETGFMQGTYTMVGQKTKPSVGKNTNEVIGQGSTTSGRITDRIVHSCTTDGSEIQSLISNRNGNQFLSGRSDSSSSEWEHVLKEELMN